MNRKENRKRKERRESEGGREEGKEREKENGNEGFSNTPNVLHLDSDSEFVCGMTGMETCILWQEFSPRDHLLTTWMYLFWKRSMNDEIRLLVGERRELCPGNLVP